MISSHPALTHRQLITIFARFVRITVDFYRRNFMSLVMTLVIPLGFLLLYSFVYYLNDVPASLRVGLLPNVSPEIAARLEQSELARVFPIRIEDGSLESFERHGVQIAVAGQDTAPGYQVLSKRGFEPTAELLSRCLLSSEAMAVTGDAKPTIQELRKDSSPLSFLPGLLLMSVMNLALFTTGAKLLEERANGTLRLMRMFPAPPWIIFSSELFSKFLLAMGQSVAFMLLGVVLLNIHFTFVQAVICLGACGLSSLALLSFGFAVGSLLPRQSTGIHLFTGLNLLMVFFGDVIFPASQFGPTKLLALALPTTYCADLLRGAMLGTKHLFPVWTSLGYITVFCALCAWLTLKRFRYTAQS